MVREMVRFDDRPDFGEDPSRRSRQEVPAGETFDRRYTTDRVAAELLETYQSKSAPESDAMVVAAGASWALYVVSLTSLGVLNEHYEPYFAAGEITVAGTMMWAYFMQLGLSLVAIPPYWVLEGGPYTPRRLVGALHWSGSDYWKHTVCGILGVFDVGSYMLAINRAGAMICSTTRLAGCLALTVALIGLVTGRMVDRLQRLLVLPILTSAVAFAGAQADHFEGDPHVGEGHDSLALALVGVSIASNSFMAVYMERAFAVSTDMIYPLRQIGDNVGTLVPLIALRLWQAFVSGYWRGEPEAVTPFFWEIKGRHEMILAFIMCVFCLSLMPVVKFCGSDMLALGKIAVLAATYGCDVSLLGKPFNFWQFLNACTILLLCSLYTLEPAVIRAFALGQQKMALNGLTTILAQNRDTRREEMANSSLDASIMGKRISQYVMGAPGGFRQTSLLHSLSGLRTQSSMVRTHSATHSGTTLDSSMDSSIRSDGMVICADSTELRAFQRPAVLVRSSTLSSGDSSMTLQLSNPSSQRSLPTMNRISDISECSEPRSSAAASDFSTSRSRPLAAELLASEPPRRWSSTALADASASRALAAEPGAAPVETAARAHASASKPLAEVPKASGSPSAASPWGGGAVAPIAPPPELAEPSGPSTLGAASATPWGGSGAEVKPTPPKPGLRSVGFKGVGFAVDADSAPAPSKPKKGVGFALPKVGFGAAASSSSSSDTDEQEEEKLRHLKPAANRRGTGWVLPKKKAVDPQKT